MDSTKPILPSVNLVSKCDLPRDELCLGVLDYRRQEIQKEHIPFTRSSLISSASSSQNFVEPSSDDPHLDSFGSAPAHETNDVPVAAPLAEPLNSTSSETTDNTHSVSSRPLLVPVEEDSAPMVHVSHSIHMDKRHFRYHYGFVKPHFLDRALKTLKKQSPSSTDSYLAPFETRMDRVLWRSGLVLSLAQARHLIHEGHVSVVRRGSSRRRVMKHPALRLFPLDVLQLGHGWYAIRETIAVRWEDSRMILPIPSYLEVDFRQGRICLQSVPKDGEVMRPVGMKISFPALRSRFKK